MPDAPFTSADLLGRALPIVRELLRDPDLAASPPPAEIGGFRVLGELGRGGMGVVYLAEQERPRRRVALKVVQPSALDASTRRRFELEVEVLGRLEHPGVARILQAGALPSGEPWFAMERVVGRRLDEHLDATALTLPGRLTLFLQVADAVHHAHLRGVIHRDLKPANVLVDEQGRARVIDFGLARLSDPEELSPTLDTQGLHVVGTVPYMSPEQASGRSEDIDLRTDVFGLGALLFRMLTGRPPLDLECQPLPRALQLIERGDPPRPSTLVPSLPEGLDWIVLKALEREPAARYGSASELSDDVRRLLAHRPLVAGPRSPWQRTRLFVRRNALAVAASTVLLVLFAAGLVGALLANAELRASEQRAEQAAATARDALVGIVDLNDVLTLDVGLREQQIILGSITRTADLLRASLADQPDVLARQLLLLGSRLMGWGHPEEALGYLDEVSASADWSGATQPTEVQVLAEVFAGDALDDLGRREEAGSRWARADAFAAAHFPEGGERRTALATSLADIQRLAGDVEGAEARLRRALEVIQPEVEPVRRWALLDGLVATLFDQRRWREALDVGWPLLLERQATSGWGNDETLGSLHNAAMTLHKLGMGDTAVAAWTDARDQLAGVLEPDDPLVLRTRRERAEMLEKLDRDEEALAEWQTIAAALGVSLDEG